LGQSARTKEDVSKSTTEEGAEKKRRAGGGGREVEEKGWARDRWRQEKGGDVSAARTFGVCSEVIDGLGIVLAFLHPLQSTTQSKHKERTTRGRLARAESLPNNQTGGRASRTLFFISQLAGACASTEHAKQNIQPQTQRTSVVAGAPSRMRTAWPQCGTDGHLRKDSNEIYKSRNEEET
jgi:hypothetical protein